MNHFAICASERFPHDSPWIIIKNGLEPAKLENFDGNGWINVKLSRKNLSRFEETYPVSLDG
jgi:hypothetical protein